MPKIIVAGAKVVPDDKEVDDGFFISSLTEQFNEKLADAGVKVSFDFRIKIEVDTLKRFGSFFTVVDGVEKKYKINRDILFVWHEVETDIEEHINGKISKALQPVQRKASKKELPKVQHMPVKKSPRSKSDTLPF